MKPLIDTTTLRRELGISKHVAEKIMRECRRVDIPGVRKHYVLREDAEKWWRERVRV